MFIKNISNKNAQVVQQARPAFEPRVFFRGSTPYISFEYSVSKIIRAMQYLLFLVLSRTPLENAHSDFMFCLNNILQQLTLLNKCKPDHPKAVLAAHKKSLCTLYNHLYFLHSWQWLWSRTTNISCSSARNLSTMVSKSQCNQSLLLASAVYSLQLQPKGKRQNTKLDFTKNPPKFQNAAKILNPWKVF